MPDCSSTTCPATWFRRYCRQTRRRFSPRSGDARRRQPGARRSMHRQRQRRDVRPLQQRRHRVRRAARHAPARPTRRRRRRLGSRVRPCPVLQDRSVRTRTVRSWTSRRPACRGCSRRRYNQPSLVQPSGDSRGLGRQPARRPEHRVRIDGRAGTRRRRLRHRARAWPGAATAVSSRQRTARSRISPSGRSSSTRASISATSTARATHGRRAARPVEEPQSEGLVFDTRERHVVRCVRDHRALQDRADDITADFVTVGREQAD